MTRFHQQHWIYRAAGWGQAGLLAFLLWLAVDHSTHERLHSDCREPQHQCAVTLLVQGKVDSPPTSGVVAEHPVRFTLIALPLSDEATRTFRCSSTSRRLRPAVRVSRVPPD